MAELNCGVCSCTHNKDKCCCKGDIMVGGKHASVKDETCCESFAEKRGDSYSSSMEHPCKTISIDCEASKCTYNSNYKCFSEQVEVVGGQACTCSETACSTFCER